MASGGGDICQIAAGIYREANLHPPSGSGEGSRSIVQGDPAAGRDSIVIQPPDGSDQAMVSFPNDQYITYKHFKVEGASPGRESNTDASGWGTASGYGFAGVSCSQTAGCTDEHHITLQDINFKHTRNSPILAQTDHLMVQDCDFEYSGNKYSGAPWCTPNAPGCTTDTNCKDPNTDCDCQSHCDAHGIYFSGTNSTFDHNTFFQPASGWNIQNYGGGGGTNNTYTRNTFKGGGQGCMTLTTGSGHVATNNVCYGQAHSVSADGNAAHILPIQANIWVDTAAKFFNNTQDGANTALAEIVNHGSSLQIYNNIFCALTSNQLTGSPDLQKNVFTCNGFQNQGNHQYQLTSAATDKIGQGLSTTAVTSVVITDINGTNRTVPYDIGAYKFGSTSTGTPTSLAFGQQPTTVVAGQTMVPAPTVFVRDESNNPMGTGSQSITVDLNPGTGPPGASIAGNPPTNAVNGTATFTNLTFTPAGGNYQLRAQSTGLTPATSTPFTVSAAARTTPLVMYTAQTGGNPTQACEGADSTHPRAGLINGLACLTVPGDTLVLLDGVYNECFDTAATPIVGGTSNSVRTTIKGQNVGGATLTPRTSPPCQTLVYFQNSAQDKFITLDNLKLDGQGQDQNNTLAFFNANDIRVQNSEIMNSFFELVFIRGSQNIEILTSKIHNAGTLTGIAGIGFLDVGTGVTIQGNEIYAIPNTGIDAQQGANNANLHILGNILHNVGKGGSKPAIVAGNGPLTGLQVNNNVIYDSFAGVQIQTGVVSGAHLFNNTIYGNQTFGIQVATDATGTLVTNTISANNATNLTGPATLTTNLQTTPGFKNPGAGDFHLIATSTAAFDQGTTLTEVLTDIEGTSRPQTITSPAYDIGAYECLPADCSTAPPSVTQKLATPYWQTGGFLRK